VNIIPLRERTVVVIILGGQVVNIPENLAEISDKIMAVNMGIAEVGKQLNAFPMEQKIP